MFQAFRFKIATFGKHVRPGRIGSERPGATQCAIFAFDGPELYRCLSAIPFYSRAIRRILTMDLRPLHDRVLVRRLEQQESMRGGIYIPDSAKEKPQQAEVVAVGSGKLLENGERAAVEVKAG